MLPFRAVIVVPPLTAPSPTLSLSKQSPKADPRESIHHSLPNGNLSMCYDELGNKYEIPPYCLSKPTNLVTDTAASPAGTNPTEAAAASPAGPAQGGGRPTGPDITLKLRLNTGGELLWTGPCDSPVSDVR